MTSKTPFSHSPPVNGSLDCQVALLASCGSANLAFQLLLVDASPDLWTKYNVHMAATFLYFFYCILILYLNVNIKYQLFIFTGNDFHLHRKYNVKKIFRPVQLSIGCSLHTVNESSQLQLQVAKASPTCSTTLHEPQQDKLAECVL